MMVRRKSPTKCLLHIHEQEKQQPMSLNHQVFLYQQNNLTSVKRHMTRSVSGMSCTAYYASIFQTCLWLMARCSTLGVAAQFR